MAGRHHEPAQHHEGVLQFRRRTLAEDGIDAIAHLGDGEVIVVQDGREKGATPFAALDHGRAAVKPEPHVVLVD